MNTTGVPVEQHGLHRQIDGVIQWPVAAVQPGVQHKQVGQIANFKAAVDRCLVAGLGGANRHPLMVGLSGNTRSGSKVPLAFIVIFCAAIPAVIGQLMVVPHSNKWVSGVHRLQIGIGAIQAVAHTVIFKTENFCTGLYLSTQLVGGYRVGIDSLGVLVNIVAQVQHQIQLGIGHMAVGIKVTLRVI